MFGRKETIEDVRRRGDLAETSRLEYKRVMAGRTDPVRIMGSEDTSRSLKEKFRVELDSAYTAEDQEKVVRHWVMKFMHGGRTKAVAEKAVLRMLREIAEEV